MKDFDLKYFLKILKSASCGRNIIYLDEIDSTNKAAIDFEKNDSDFLRDLKNKNFKGSAVIAAEKQTEGAGRQGKKWHSPSGGLWFTVILKEDLGERQAVFLNMVAAVSVYESLISLYSLKTSVKWPNDIYVKNKKLCGILSEIIRVKDIDFVNIGIGINVNNELLPEDGFSKQEAESSISLRSILGMHVPREELLAEILKTLEINFNSYIKNKDLKIILERSQVSIVF